MTQNVDVRCSLVDIAEDYTKRKHVLRLANPSAEVLLQTEDAASMALWLRALHEHAAAEKPSVSSERSECDCDSRITIIFTVQCCLRPFRFRRSRTIAR